MCTSQRTSDLKRRLLFWKCLLWFCLKAVSMPTFVWGSLRGSTAMSGSHRVFVCLHGHFKPLSRCRLVGGSVHSGENFFPTSRLQLSQRRPPKRSQNYWQIFEVVRFFSLFKTIFKPFPFSVYYGERSPEVRVQSAKELLVESACGLWLTSKSICVVSAWALTSDTHVDLG